MEYKEYIKTFFGGEDSEIARTLFDREAGHKQSNKELRSLNELVDAKDGSKSIDTFLNKSVNIIAGGMHFPEKALVIIEMGETYSNYDASKAVETGSSLRKPIRLKNKESGKISIFYLGNIPFLESEKKIITEYAKRIGQGIEKIKKDKEKEHLCFFDPLTDIYNRAYFEQEYKHFDTKRQLPLSIIIGDLDLLKYVNDNFGHKEGDKLLQKVAYILKKSCRDEDIIARWGGDEYAILLPKTDSKNCKLVVNRIKKLSRKENEMFPCPPLSISIGCATKDVQSQSLDDVFMEAEDKMYKEKKLKNNKREYMKE